MQTDFQLASIHGMLYTGGNVAFSADGGDLLSPVMNSLSSVHLRGEGSTIHPCSNSTLQCFALSPDGDLAFAVGQRGLGFFYLISARVVIETLSFPPECSIACVAFSPCARYIAVAMECGLQIFSTPSRRTVGYHDCHRLENYHAALTLPILSIQWSADSNFLLIAGRDARIAILPRQSQMGRKRAAAQKNLLIGHRSGVLGAWFADSASTAASRSILAATGSDKQMDEEAAGQHKRVVSVSADNVVILWRQTSMTRQEVKREIVVHRQQAKLSTLKDGEQNDEEEEEEEGIHHSDEEAVPLSFLEKQRVRNLMEHGERFAEKDDSSLPDLLRYAFEVDKKYMLQANGSVSVADYHAEKGLLALGYSSGSFAIYHTSPSVEESVQQEDGGAASSSTSTLPLIHLLSLSAQALTAVRFSPSGDHIAFGSEHLKQLLVWDWKGETYVLKEQAHYYNISRTAMTSDSEYVLSGGEDGKVKVWRASSGQCIVTFTEHTAPITGIATCSSTNAVFTSSLDGTARAFDLLRYRPFRVFTAPGEAGGYAHQFSCLAVDPSGEVLAVGSQQMNRIFLFAVQTGGVIDVLQGHETAITCLAFHTSGTTLVSGAQDQNLIFWDLFTPNDGRERLKGDGEVVNIGTEVLSITYNGSGRRMAVLTAKQEVTVYDTTVPADPQLVKTFLTKFDAAGGWSKRVGPQSANVNTHFTRISLSPEGDRLLAAGDSKWIVLYDATQGYLLKKWAITSNLDILGAEEQFQWRSMTEAGFLGDIDVDDDDVHLRQRKLIEMPGSRHAHFATGKRKTQLTAQTSDICFASTGTEFIAATTVGLLVFTTRLGRAQFHPLQLVSATITPEKIRHQLLKEGQPVLALIGSLILGDQSLGVECMRRMPLASIPIASAAVPTAAFTTYVRWVAEEVEASPGWERALLFAQSLMLHSNEASGRHGADNATVIPALKSLQRSLLKQRALADEAQRNYFRLRYLIDITKVQQRKLDKEAAAMPASTAESAVQ